MLSEAHTRGIEERGLSVELAADMGLHSGTLLRDGSIVPDPKGNVLCIPYFERDEEVNTKYRWREDGQRMFRQRKNAVKTVYNANILLNDETHRELQCDTASLIWVEGEFDCLASIESGFPHTISVPDGAPPARDKLGRLIHVPDDDHDIDPEDDDKFSFMGRLMERIMLVKTHIIATDNDEPGRRLAKELVRRIGAARCRFITYPTDEVVPVAGKKRTFRAPKDLNEVKKYLGVEKVREIIELAKPWPIRGLFKLSDYPEVDMPTMLETGISKLLDEKMKIYPGQFIVCTGIPNSGKSTFINQVSVSMAERHKWPQAIFSGEKLVKPFLANELMTAFLKKPIGSWTSEEAQRARAFVERYYRFIDYDEQGDDVEMDLDFVLDKAATAVFRDGVRMLIIDPWNELEHRRSTTKSLTEYTGDAIRKMKRFGKKFECAVVVVAHPTKIDPKTIPGLYNISDSAHWSNKSDLGIVVHGEDHENTERQIYINKVRLRRIAGDLGVVDLQFDTTTNLFVDPDF